MVFPHCKWLRTKILMPSLVSLFLSHPISIHLQILSALYLWNITRIQQLPITLPYSPGLCPWPGLFHPSSNWSACFHPIIGSNYPDLLTVLYYVQHSPSSVLLNLLFLFLDTLVLNNYMTHSLTFSVHWLNAILSEKSLTTSNNMDLILTIYAPLTLPVTIFCFIFSQVFIDDWQFIFLFVYCLNYSIRM